MQCRHTLHGRARYFFQVRYCCSTIQKRSFHYALFRYFGGLGGPLAIFFPWFSAGVPGMPVFHYIGHVHAGSAVINEGIHLNDSINVCLTNIISSFKNIFKNRAQLRRAECRKFRF
jgi:hypothetical protein